MTKEEVQSRVSFNDLSLPLKDFDWDEENRIFSSRVNGLVLDFKDINGVTFTTSYDCTFDTGSNCKFNTNWNCTFKTSNNCTFDTDDNCTFDTGSRSKFDTGWNCKFNTGSHCTFKTSNNCTFDTGSNCTFNTGYTCTFKTSYGCTFDTGSKCTFDTGSDCTFDTCDDCMFKTGSNCTFTTDSGCTFTTGNWCTFKTSYDCTFNTGWGCVFNTGGNCVFKTSGDCKFNTYSDCTFNIDEQCVIIRRDIYEVIPDKKEIQLCPSDISGYLEKIDGTWYLDGDTSLGEHIIADKILSKVISKKKLDSGTLYRVYNYTNKGISSMLSYLIEIDGIYSHGDSIRDVKDSIMYKMVDRDTSAYTDMTLDTVYTIPEAIKMYRTITGACSKGVKMFVENTDNVPDTITVQDILNITSGQYGHEKLKEYIDKTI